MYWNSWRRINTSFPTAWSLNRMPGMMLHNNARMQFMQTPQLNPSTQPVYMAPPQHNINKFYNNPLNIYEESQPQLVPQQPQFIPQPQFQTVKFVEPKGEIVTPPSLSPTAINQEPQDEFENKLNLTEPLCENPEIAYNSLLPQVMTEVIVLLFVISNQIYILISFQFRDYLIENIFLNRYVVFLYNNFFFKS